MKRRMRSTLFEFFQASDKVLLTICCLTTLFGISLIFSATRYLPTANGTRRIITQSAALCIGICVYLFISLVDIEALIKRWKLLIVFNVGFIMLLKTPFGVSDQTGNTAWLKFPGIPFSIGPAEIVKISFILLLARQLEWLKMEHNDLHSFQSAMFVAGHTFALCGLYVLISGDMGNALVFLFIFMAMAFVAGFALRWFVLLLGGMGGTIVLAWKLDLIPRYMRERFYVIFDHSYDVMNRGWQQTRSLLAIGSGGVLGQGYLNGTQTQSAFSANLPERHTDFIFAVCGEELGLVGCCVIMLLLFIIILRVLIVAHNAHTMFQSLVCVGMAAMLIFQTIINIGMCLFVMPVIGITLPFFSYGGSSIVTSFMAMGVVSGIHKNSVIQRSLHNPR